MKIKGIKIIFVIFFAFTNIIIAQNQLLETPIGSGLSPFYDYNSKLAIGWVPNAAHPAISPLHLLSPTSSLSVNPVLRAEVTSPSPDYRTNAAIELLVQGANGFNYGIRQTSIAGTIDYNYFQDPLLVGRIGLQSDNSHASAINVPLSETNINFHWIGTSQTADPLVIYPGGVVVNTYLTTTNFKMTSNASTGMVLMSSDNLGNALWTDPSSIVSNDWIFRRNDGDLYSNTYDSRHEPPINHNVGVGFHGIENEEPKKAK